MNQAKLKDLIDLRITASEGLRDNARARKHQTKVLRTRLAFGNLLFFFGLAVFFLARRNRLEALTDFALGVSFFVFHWLMWSLSLKSYAAEEKIWRNNVLEMAAMRRTLINLEAAGQAEAVQTNKQKHETIPE